MKTIAGTGLPVSVLGCTVLGCAALGCAQPAQSAQAPSPILEEADSIVGGSADPDDPSVVAVYGAQPGARSGFLCTGSVIAPSVILTAAHCVSPLETGAGAVFTVITGSDIDKGAGQELAVSAVHANPLWSADNLENGHDQGIVVLSQPMSLRPLPINRRPLGSSQLGRAVRIVGYGLDDGSRQTGADVKRQALTTLGSILTNLVLVGNSRHGTCNGDSGGPAFMNVAGVETIVGTTSYGNADCTDGGFDARVDTDLAFIDQYLPSDCQASCDGRSCGSDGCGSSCGSCGGGELCSADGQCVPATGGCENGGLEQEPNDTALDANALCTGGTSRGTVATAGDTDWFTWSVNADVVYTVTLAPASSDPALRVYKISATGRLSFIGDGPTVERHTDLGGTYVARISTSAAPGATYTLTATTAP
jgi:V8-like Glu-specific endopeptidase